MKNQQTRNEEMEEAKVTGIDKKGNLATAVLKPTLSVPIPKEEPAEKDKDKDRKKKEKKEKK